MGNKTAKIAQLSAENKGYQAQLDTQQKTHEEKDNIRKANEARLNEARSKNDELRDAKEACLNEHLRDVKADKQALQRQVDAIDKKRIEDEDRLKQQFEKDKEQIHNRSYERQKELQAEYDKKIKDCRNAANEEKKACEKKMDDLNAQLMAVQEERIDETKKHGEKVEELHSKHEEKVDGIRVEAANKVEELLREKEEKTEKLLRENDEKVDEVRREANLQLGESRRENLALERNMHGQQLAFSGALAHGTFVNFAEKGADEFKRNPIGRLRESQTNKHSLKNQLHGRIETAKSKKKSGGLFRAARGKAENAQDIYDQLDKESTVSRSLVDHGVDTIGNSAFSATRREQGKELLSTIRDNITASDKALAECKGKKLHSVCLDEFVKCLNAIDEALDNFPSMVEETVASYIDGGLTHARLVGTNMGMAIDSQ